MEATTKDLRLRTKTLIAATDRGEEVTITYRGKPRARLVPLNENAEAAALPEVREGEAPAYRAERNPAFGLWRDRDEPGPAPDEDAVDAYVRRVRRPREF